MYFDSVNSQLDSLNQIYESGIVNPIFVDLLDGWNMIGYTSPNTDTDVEVTFEPIINNPLFSSIEYPVIIVKNIRGKFWSLNLNLII